MKRIQYAGRVGRWTVLSEYGPYGSGGYGWNCRCECGTERVVFSGTLGKILSGKAPNGGCGCHKTLKGRELTASVAKRFNMKKAECKRKGIPFNLDHSDFEIPEYCPLLHIRLIEAVPQTGGKGGGRDNSPSMDRIDPSKGYVKGNVQMLSYKANMIKSNATTEEIGMVYRNLLKTRG